MFDLRRQLMSASANAGREFLRSQSRGAAGNARNDRCGCSERLFASGLVTIIGDLFMLSFVIATMFRLSPGLTCFLLAVMPLVVLVTIQFRRSAVTELPAHRVAIAKINAYLQEHITGIAVLQLFNREERSRSEFEKINRDHMEAYKDSITAYGWFYPVVEFLGDDGARAAACLWRISHPTGRADAGRVGGLFSVRTCVSSGRSRI